MRKNLLNKYIKYQLKLTKKNSMKVSPDTDITYLHKYRVSLRRIRSLYIIFYPEKNYFDKSIKDIVQKTNELRELDVFLHSLNSDKYPLLFKLISEYRRARFEKVWTQEFVKKTIKKLNELDKYIKTKNITVKEKEMIAKIERFYFKSLKIFNKIDKNTPDKKLHKLRIKFKISRYALEFLNDNKICNELENIIVCKKKQNYFGEIQDALNQLEFIESFCKNNSCIECKEILLEYENHLKTVKNNIIS